MLFVSTDSPRFETIVNFLYQVINVKHGNQLAPGSFFQQDTRLYSPLFSIIHVVGSSFDTVFIWTICCVFIYTISTVRFVYVYISTKCNKSNYFEKIRFLSFNLTANNNRTNETKLFRNMFKTVTRLIKISPLFCFIFFFPRGANARHKNTKRCTGTQMPDRFNFKKYFWRA